jgi:hypothetical protein
MNVLSRGRRIWIAVILVLAIICGLGAVTATWVRRQALDTNNWTATSAKLLQDPKIRTAVADYLVNQLFTQVNVPEEIRGALPKQLQGIAGPIAGGLRQVAEQAAPDLLARPRVQEAWVTANRAAHKELVKLLNGGGPALSTTNGEVVLNLHALVLQLAAQLGINQSKVNGALSTLQGAANGGAGTALQQKVGVKLPPNLGHLVVMRSKQLKTAQDVAKAIKSLSIILTALTIILFALAVWLAPGARRIVLRRVGWSLIGIGLLALIVRRVGGNNVTNSLVQVDSIKAAVHNAWTIGTSLLFNIGLAMIVYGALVVAYAFLIGDTKWAVSARRWLAPVFRDRIGVVYGVVGGLFLLVLAWGPTPAFRKLIPVLLFAALLVLAVEVLRRQEDREFPDGALQELPTPALASHD